MTTTLPGPVSPGLVSRLVNALLAIKPLANFAKERARKMMIDRAESLGVPWRAEVERLRSRDWEREKQKIENPQLTYPAYYLRSFHAYEEGNLSWEAALEVEVAAKAVHSRIWPDSGAEGDGKLRETYHRLLQEHLPHQPQKILDLGCSVGMSTFALQEAYPQAQLTGLDLSPYFLTVANYRAQERNLKINWYHAAAEATGLPATSFELVSAFLLCHELPQRVTEAILQEARRLLKPGGYFAFMDTNPHSEIYAQMPPYILTLLKSTEPYLDEYFRLDMAAILQESGFKEPQIIANTPRHRTVIAQVN